MNEEFPLEIAIQQVLRIKVNDHPRGLCGRLAQRRDPDKPDGWQSFHRYTRRVLLAMHPPVRVNHAGRGMTFFFNVYARIYKEIHQNQGWQQKQRALQNGLVCVINEPFQE